MAQVSLFHIKYALEEYGFVSLVVGDELSFQNMRTGEIFSIPIKNFYLSHQEAHHVLKSAGLSDEIFKLYSFSKGQP